MLQIGLLFLLLLSEHVASAPPPIIYHIPFSLRPGEHGGCCGDITALNEHNGIAHLFKESGGKCALPPPQTTSVVPKLADTAGHRFHVTMTCSSTRGTASHQLGPAVRFVIWTRLLLICEICVHMLDTTPVSCVLVSPPSSASRVCVCVQVCTTTPRRGSDSRTTLRPTLCTGNICLRW